MPVLRMYEWERIRQVPFQIDAYLPDGSPVLYVRVRISNPHPHEVPMYWWSNIAVPERTDTRVVVPADAAYSFGYGEGGLRRVSVPEVDGTDVTYPTNIGRSADFFFHVPEAQRPWITALDGEGKGLIQVSTERLHGRKLFLWGMGAGGRRWQQFLSQPGEAYIEIQAGLARTQMEHLPMDAGAEWTWLEAYGLMEADPDAVHGAGWVRAQEAVEHSLGRMLPSGILDRELESSATFADRPPTELIQRGSGWGALERLRREAAGEPPFCSPALVFDDASLGAEQQPWLDLLYDGGMSSPAPNVTPVGCVVQDEWHTLLADAVREGRGSNWLAWMHLGVMRYRAGDRSGARQAWESSLTRARTPWALRNLAVLAQEEGSIQEAADLYGDAVRLRPDLLPLAVECGRLLLAAERPEEWLDLLPEMHESVRMAGRVRLLEGQAALDAGDLERVEQLFATPLVIDDLREGERSLSHLWFEYHERRLSAAEGAPIDDALRERVRRTYPVPPEIDFRMS
jgi:tetratricopeptide (TPR) repeat protein